MVSTTTTFACGGRRWDCLYALMFVSLFLFLFAGWFISLFVSLFIYLFVTLFVLRMGWLWTYSMSVVCSRWSLSLLTYYPSAITTSYHNYFFCKGHTYSPLTSSDIDCTDSTWKDDCTMEFCSRQTHAQLQAATIMSIPYIISACLSPVLGEFLSTSLPLSLSLSRCCSIYLYVIL